MISPGAKWGAVGFLSGASLVGLFWAVSAPRTPSPTYEPRPPVTIPAEASRTPPQSPPPQQVQPSPGTSTRLDTRVHPDQPTRAAPIPTRIENPDAVLPEVTDAAAPEPDAAEGVPQELPHSLAPASPLLLVNVNTASQAELELLPRIGPALAARIIESRRTEGPFRTLKDLERVSGIGPKTVERLKPHVAFD
jgi:competence protein ComEA